MLPIDFYCALAQAWDGSGALLLAAIAPMCSTASKSWLYKQHYSNRKPHSRYLLAKQWNIAQR